MELNLFKGLSLLLAFSAFIKVFFGIFFHKQLYEWARSQYAQIKRTTFINVLLAYALFLLVLVWVETIRNYTPNGWVLTSFITIASLKSLNLLFNWKKTALKFVRFIDNAGNKLWIIDLIVGILGVAFLYLGFGVY